VCVEPAAQKPLINKDQISVGQLRMPRSYRIGNRFVAERAHVRPRAADGHCPLPAPSKYKEGSSTHERLLQLKRRCRLLERIDF
jgi:hypothetical protein